MLLYNIILLTLTLLRKIMQNLKDVTLCIVDCKNYDNAAKAISYCANECNIKFKESIYFSDLKHKNLDKQNILFKEIKKIKNTLEYDNFILKELYKHINSDFVLVVQHDGIIYNQDMWTEDFLKYDYIGSPWPHAPKFKNNVGNGGFSLRSKKFIDKVADFIGNDNCYEPEDVYCCETLCDQMISLKFKYADILTAANFSTELRCTFSNIDSFGFHHPIRNGFDIHKLFLKEIYENLYKDW